jgi:hypothetical protein
MGAIGFPETSVRYYHYSVRNNPEERSSEQKNDFYGNKCIKKSLTLCALPDNLMEHVCTYTCAMHKQANPVLF